MLCTRNTKHAAAGVVPHTEGRCRCAFVLLFFSPESRTWHVLLQLGFALSLHSLSLSLSVPDDAHSRGWKWVQTVRSFVRPSFALLLFRAEHLRKGDEVQSKVESWVESWVHPVI